MRTSRSVGGSVCAACTCVVASLLVIQPVWGRGGSGALDLEGTPLYSATLNSRAITAENQKGDKGQGGQKMGGRKGLPCLWNLKKDQVYTFSHRSLDNRPGWVELEPASEDGSSIPHLLASSQA